MYWRPKLRVRRNSLEVGQPVREQVRPFALVRQTVLRHARLPEERVTFLLLRPQLGGKTVSLSHVLSQLERGTCVSIRLDPIPRLDLSAEEFHLCFCGGRRVPAEFSPRWPLRWQR